MTYIQKILICRDGAPHRLYGDGGATIFGVFFHSNITIIMLPLRPFIKYYNKMKFRLLFCLLSITCTLSMGFAQCPDSVHVYVNPQVICPGEVAHLSTDSIQLHCVNVGDIICVHNDLGDTAIVTPEEWTGLGLSSTYTPLSVVFYVDETCRHGWAVKAGTYTTAKWNSNGRSQIDETGIANFSSVRTAIKDIDGSANTDAVRISHPGSSYYPAFFSPNNPFYLPAIGQLNVLFSVKDRISYLLDSYLHSAVLPNENWWSSTESDYHSSPTNYPNAYYLNNSGIVSTEKKTNAYHVLPVMNF